MLVQSLICRVSLDSALAFSFLAQDSCFFGVSGQTSLGEFDDTEETFYIFFFRMVNKKKYSTRRGVQRGKGKKNRKHTLGSFYVSTIDGGGRRRNPGRRFLISINKGRARASSRSREAKQLVGLGASNKKKKKKKFQILRVCYHLTVL